MGGKRLYTVCFNKMHILEHGFVKHQTTGQTWLTDLGEFVSLDRSGGGQQLSVVLPGEGALQGLSL